MTAKLGRTPMSLSAVASRTGHAMIQDARSALPEERAARVKQLRADLAWLRTRERHAEEALRTEQHRIQRTIVAIARWGQGPEEEQEP